MVCYNILAEVYTDTDYSRNDLFSYCPNEYLDYDYRKLLLANELVGESIFKGPMIEVCMNYTIFQLDKLRTVSKG